MLFNFEAEVHGPFGYPHSDIPLQVLYHCQDLLSPNIRTLNKVERLLWGYIRDTLKLTTPGGGSLEIHCLAPAPTISIWLCVFIPGYVSPFMFQTQTL